MLGCPDWRCCYYPHIPYPSLRAQIYLCELISIFLIFNLCTCANLCLSARIYVLGVGACAILFFRVGACSNPFFYLFVSKSIISMLGHAQIYFFVLAHAQIYIFIFPFWSSCVSCANLFFRDWPMRDHAQIHFCRFWLVRYFTFPFWNGFLPCANLFVRFWPMRYFEPSVATSDGNLD